MRANDITRHLHLTGKAAIAPPSREELEDAYRSLAARLHEQLGASGNHSAAILLTATQSGEGLSTTAVNLARALTELIPKSTAAVVESSGAETGVGWVQVVREGIRLEDALQSVNGSRLSVLPRGHGSGVSEPSSVSEGDVSALLASLRKAFSYVVIDGPLLHARADLAIWMAGADAVAVVVEANRIRRESLAPNVKFLSESSVPFLGIVLNKRQHFIPDQIYHRL